MKLPIALSGRTLICSIVIALTTTTVIQTVLCTSIGDASQQQQLQKPSPIAAASAGPAIESPKVGDSIDVASKPELIQAKSAAPTQGASKSSSAADSSAAADQEAAGSRRGRSEAPPAAPATDKAASPPAAAATTIAPTTPTTTSASSSGDKQSSSKPAVSGAKPAPVSGKHQQQQQLSGKTGASGPNKKSPANLGTVTSTGSGGPAHYMSKHDAYSAIAEKHGALAQDAMRKADKRQHLQRFSGIQKAGGFGDMLSPFKGVTDSGLARSKYDHRRTYADFTPI